MKFWIQLFIVTLVFTQAIFGQTQIQHSAYVDQLISTIEQTPQFDAKKVVEIQRFKHQLNKINSHSALLICLDSLFNEYCYFQYDSALYYAQTMQKVANQHGNQYEKAKASLRMGFILLSSGMFKEAFDVLNKISISHLSTIDRANYYSLLGRYYYDLTDYHETGSFNNDYIHQATIFLDSALVYFPKQSFEYQYYSGLKFLKLGQLLQANEFFQHILYQPASISLHQLALTTSTLSGLYEKQQKTDSAIIMLVKAAIADVASSTKETTATLRLAGVLFQLGFTQKALLCIQKANTDAQFYGSRLRKVQIAGLLPLIEGEVLSTMTQQKRHLFIYAGIATILLLLVIILAILFFRQMSKMQIINTALAVANEKEMATNLLLKDANKAKEDLNQQLQFSNAQLREANKIKEEYVGFFFQMDYQLIEKMEHLKLAVDKKLAERKYDELKLIVGHLQIQEEKNRLLNNFDKVFLKLFPQFIDEFNALFLPEHQFVLKEKNILNTELRIFALIRLGITDNEKIAQILNYSVNTIYSYKTKIRNKSFLNNEDFDSKICGLGAH